MWALWASLLVALLGRSDALVHQSTTRWSSTEVHFDADLDYTTHVVKYRESQGGGWEIGFGESAYVAMRDDVGRTDGFERAIRERLETSRRGAVVLDLGTGPFALLALMAARHGARKVYAIEGDAAAARAAREVVRREVAAGRVRAGQVEVVEGVSTEVSLPERVDLIVSEIAGSIATEEGLRPTLEDAAARFARRPEESASWIPTAFATFAAPASYAPHVLAPDLDWRPVASAAPMRCSCRDVAVQLLAPPQPLEFVECRALGDGRSGWKEGPTVSFDVDVGRAGAIEKDVASALAPGGDLHPFTLGQDPARLARDVASHVSGLAMWPCLYLDDCGDVVVRARGPSGEPMLSSWQTAVALGPRAARVSDGTRIGARLDSYDAAGRLVAAPQYRLHMRWS